MWVGPWRTCCGHEILIATVRVRPRKAVRCLVLHDLSLEAKKDQSKDSDLQIAKIKG